MVNPPLCTDLGKAGEISLDALQDSNKRAPLVGLRAVEARESGKRGWKEDEGL